MATTDTTRAHSSANSPLVAVIQATVPAYRKAFLQMLEERLAGALWVLAGRDDFETTIRLEAEPSHVTRVRNHYLLRRRLLWQRDIFAAGLQADVLVADLNPRILSTWVILLLRRALGKPSVLWGHAWPRRGAAARTDPFRHAMRRLAHAIIAYTETEARELRRRMPGTLVAAAPNALYPLAAERDGAEGDGRRAADFVYVGRLVDSKKPRLLLESFLLARDDLPRETRLVFVGDGPLRPALEKRASRDPDGVVFLGARSGFDEVGRVYAGALASVIPGYAGLSLIQSLWFGVPALIAKDEPHSPEIEAAIEGINAVFFKSDSATSLRDALVAAAADRDLWRLRRDEIARECASRYSLDGMVDAFIEVIAELAQ